VLPAGSIVGALCHKLKTQSSAPEDGQNYCPKHVELIEIIQAASSVHYATNWKHSLVLLKMDEIIVRNMLSWLKLLIKLLLFLHLVGCLYYCISDARSHKHHKYILHHICKPHSVSQFTRYVHNGVLPQCSAVDIACKILWINTNEAKRSRQ